MRSHRVFTWMCLSASALMLGCSVVLDLFDDLHTSASLLALALSGFTAVLGLFSAVMRAIEHYDTRAVKARGGGPAL